MQNKQLLILGSVWPEPNSSAAGRRMMQLVQLFQSAGWQLTFASASGDQPHATDLNDHGVETEQIEINSPTFDDFIADLGPDAVMFDRFITEEQFGWRVAKQCPQALRLLDTEDLHCLRRARRKAVEQNRSFHLGDLLKNETAKREIASILRCDLSLVISEYEMSLLKNLFEVDPSLLFYLPFMLDAVTEEVRAGWPTYEKREHFATIGNFRHGPNLDGIQYLSTSIWPLVRKKLPQAEMHVYGAYPTQEAKQLHQPEAGFYIKGRADDAQAVMRQARVCLTPLRFGAGLKGKLVEAMQCGTPSVTTPVGAEGLAGNLAWPGALEETPETFAEAAISLYNDSKQWEQARQQGAKIINERFAKQGKGAELLNKIKQIRQNLEAHRRQNFTGAMLRHHSMQSTKYMARWIEAKNH